MEAILYVTLILLCAWLQLKYVPWKIQSLINILSNLENTLGNENIFDDLENCHYDDFQNEHIPAGA